MSRGIRLKDRIDPPFIMGCHVTTRKSCLVCVRLRHSTLGRHGVTTGALLLSDVVLVGHGLVLVNGHVAGMHLRVLLWHAWALLLGRQMLCGGFLRRLDWILVINPIFSAASRFWRVQAGLRLASVTFITLLAFPIHAQNN